jgi:hypothetical protein
MMGFTSFYMVRKVFLNSFWLLDLFELLQSIHDTKIHLKASTILSLRSTIHDIYDPLKSIRDKIMTMYFVPPGKRTFRYDP